MKKIKKSLMALAAFCAITSSANAYTLGETFRYPNIPDYHISFFNIPSDWGKCIFCWYTNCWKYDYFYDGYYTIIIDKVGVYYLNKNKTRLYNATFKEYFKTTTDTDTDND